MKAVISHRTPRKGAFSKERCLFQSGALGVDRACLSPLPARNFSRPQYRRFFDTATPWSAVIVHRFYFSSNQTGARGPSFTTRT